MIFLEMDLNDGTKLALNLDRVVKITSVQQFAVIWVDDGEKCEKCTLNLSYDALIERLKRIPSPKFYKL